MALQEEFEAQGIWLFKYRGTLPILILLIGLALYLKTKIYDHNLILETIPYDTYFEIFCLFISLIGLGIRFYTVGHSSKNTSGRNTKEQVADSLNTTGVYSIVRHPLYLGNFFMWLGPALLTVNLWFIIAFCLFYWVYYERIMFAEEQYLRRKFGTLYTDWSKDVPAFIPRFKQFKTNNLPFNLKKVIRQEKTGIVATFIVFSLFDFLGNLITEQSRYNYVFIIGLTLSILYYIVLKILQKQTKILEDNSLHL